MNHSDLPERWKTRLVQWIREFADDERTHLECQDFPMTYSVSIRLEDESSAQFEYAILIVEPRLHEIGIFTEHCGYHIFPLDGSVVAKIEK